MIPRREATAEDAFQVERFGRDGGTVVVVDDATGAADALIDYAATRSRFVPAATVGQGYPGLLGPAPADYIDALVQRVLPLIAAYFGTGPVRPVRARGNFSLVTTAPEALTPEQRMPHVDTVDQMQFACVHYLCAPDAGGTGFFRHRATGFEMLDAERLPRYQAALDAEEGAATGYPSARDAGGFELIHACDAAIDRLILYRAAALHSGLISGVGPWAADPRVGRLTGNLFLDCRAVAA